MFAVNLEVIERFVIIYGEKQQFRLLDKLAEFGCGPTMKREVVKRDLLTSSQLWSVIHIFRTVYSNLREILSPTTFPDRRFVATRFYFT